MANGIFQSLLNRLNRVFNKDPRALTAFQIKVPVQGKMVVADNTLKFTGVGATTPLLSISLVDPYDAAKTITVQSLYDQLNVTPGFAVQNLNPALAPLGCIALIEGEYNFEPTAYANVPVALSLLWAFYRPIANALEQAKGDIEKAIQQLSYVTAQGDFLDYWGSIFGIPRYSSLNADGTRNVEGDYEYSLRLLWETVKPRLNNKAIEELLRRGTGLDTTIVDMSSKMLLTDGFTNPTHIEGAGFEDATMVTDSHLDNPNQGFPDDQGRYTMGDRYNFGSFGVFIDQPLNVPSYQYTEEQIAEIVNRHRAAGTTPWFVITQVAREVLSLISKVAYDLEGSIDQQIAEDRVMFFGHPDQQFYFDHWTQENVAKMPWLQDNLEKPSLTDNVVMESELVQKAPDQQTEVEGVFTDGALMDGFLGSFNRNVAHMDSTDDTDDFGTVRYVSHTFPVNGGKAEYVFSPVVLNYKRVTDDFITPRIEETLGDDVLTVKVTDVSGQVAAFKGAGALTNVLPSGDVVITTPVHVTAPVGITGLKFDEIELSALNLKDLPSVIRNLEIPDLGENWNETYGVTRRYVIPYQDADGNRFYMLIEIPALNPPPVTSLRIANPTADISADRVLITSGQDVTVSWHVTNSQAATLVRTRISDNTVVSSQSITYTGAITYQLGSAVTEDTKFTIIATGNNNQTAEHSVTIHIVAAASTAVAPAITASAVPDVVQLCSNQQTTITYSVDFKSKQTETATHLFVDGASFFILGSFESDPQGTVILSPEYGGRTISVADSDTGDLVEGTFTFDSGFAIFTPADLTKAAGKNLTYNYDVNYGGSTLSFNGKDVVLPDSGEVFQITQQATVTVPEPKAIVSGTSSGANLFNASELPVSQVSNWANYWKPAMVAGFDNAYRSEDSNFKSATVKMFLKANTNYVVSCFIKRDDGTTPATGSSGAGADMNPYINTWIGGLYRNVVLVSGTTYRMYGYGSVTQDGYYDVGFQKGGGTNAGGVTWWGPQLELGTTPTTYVKTPYPGVYVTYPSTYTADYEIVASNYAATSTRKVPVFVQAIQEGSGRFAVTGVNPAIITEAIGDLAAETETITLTGQGFSSKMQVLLQSTAADGLVQLTEAPVTSIDWVSGSLTFIAPRFLAGTYPIIVNKLNCLGETVATDKTQSLQYGKHPTYYLAPEIQEVQPAIMCVDKGTQDITLVGNNFRTGAQVAIWKGGAWVNKTTTVFQPCAVSGKSALKFTMDETTLGYYNLRVTNTDTSVGCLDNGLRLINSATPITVNDFGISNPTNADGTCAFYGLNGFNLHWDVDASYVSFLSSDSKVQPYLASPDPLGFPPKGSLVIPIYQKGTTITLSAVNACGTVKNQTFTVSQVECERTTGIQIIPDPVVLTDRNPVKVHCYQKTIKDSTGETFSYDITDDVALSYTLLANPDNCVALTGTLVSANLNRIAKIQATWNGFTDTADIVVQLPEPMALTVTPSPILYNNINETFQLKVAVQYTDGSVKDDVSHDSATIYRGYDPNVISVSTTGFITTKVAGATHVEVSYTDVSVNPTKVVTANVQVGKQDPCIGFERIYVEPSFAVAGSLNAMPVDFEVTNVNPQGLVVMADSTGKASYSYTGTTGGTDTVTATYKGKVGNPTKVQWFDPGVDLASTPVKVDIYTGGSNGTINFGGQYWKGTGTYYSLYFNDPTVPGSSGQAARPMKVYTFNANGTATAQTIAANAGSPSVGLTAFQAILTGSFLVKKAGTYTFQFYADDAFYLGIKGATRVSGSNNNVPATTYLNRYPVMGGYNAPEGANLNTITVTFPSVGVYPYEINYCEGSGNYADNLQLSVFCNNQRIKFVDLPAAVTNTVTNGDVTLKLLSSLPLFVGQIAQLEAQLANVDKVGNVTFTALADNVRTAILNGTSVYNGQLQNPLNYTLNETLKDSKTYRMTISNLSGQITATATANIVNFAQPVLKKFALYDGSNPNSPEVASGSVTVAFGSPVGVLWNVSNAAKVQLYDSVDDTTWDLPNAGSRYLVPASNRTLTLNAWAADGTQYSWSLAVVVTDYQSYTHDWSTGLWYAPGYTYHEYPDYWFAEATEQVVQLGKSSTVSLPAFNGTWVDGWWDGYYHPYKGAPYYYPGNYDDRWFQRVSSMSEHGDAGFSTDGTRPTLKPENQVYSGRIQQFDNNIVAPTTNTFYGFNVTGTWFWYYYGTYAYEQVPTGYWTGTQWQVPYQDSWSHTWSWGFNTAVNVDPGPKFVSATASATRVTAGQPVTISYETQFASKVQVSAAPGVNLPLGKVSFTVYPDKTTDYTFTATSPTGLTATSTVHVDVTPQVLYAPCAQLPVPQVNYIAIDGKTAQYLVTTLTALTTSSVRYAGGLLSVNEQEEVHVLEIFGNHFLGDRAVSPEITGQVQVLLENTLGQKVTGIEVTEVVAQSNTYIRCKLHVHPYSVAGTYVVAVMNDVGVSTDNGQKQAFNVKVSVPTITMNKAISAHSGDVVTLYVDWYDPVRDAGMTVMVGDTAVTPRITGSNLSNMDYVIALFRQVNGVAPHMDEISTYVSQLDNNIISRYDLMMQTIGNKDVTVAVGTPIQVAVSSATTVGLTVKTANGTSNSIQWVPIPAAPPITIVPTTNPVISGLSPAYGYAGATIAVYGSNFTGACQIYVGNTLATSTFVNSTKMTFVVPAGYAATTTTTVMVKLGTYATTYNGFRVLVTTAVPYQPPTTIYYDPQDAQLDGTMTKYGTAYTNQSVAVQPVETVVTTSINNQTVSDGTGLVGSLLYVDTNSLLRSTQ